MSDRATWQVAVVLGAISRHAHLATLDGRSLCGHQLAATVSEDPTLPHATRCRDCLEAATGSQLRELDYP